VRTAGLAISDERSVNAIRRYLRMHKVTVVRQVRVYACHRVELHPCSCGLPARSTNGATGSASDLQAATSPANDATVTS
jgi:hypothetical protein